MASRSFSLVEILVSLIILSFIGSVLIFKGHRMVAYYKKRAAFSKLVEEFDEAICLASAHGIDITFEVMREKGGARIHRHSDEMRIDRTAFFAGVDVEEKTITLYSTDVASVDGGPLERSSPHLLVDGDGP